MSLNEYFNEIESLEFQIQFSVVGGFKILQMAMARHPTLVNLIADLTDNAAQSKAVYDRITLLLTKVETESQLSYDESVAAYLYCLTKADISTAEKASQRILETGGLWWSVQLALHVIETVDTEVA